MEQTNLKSEQNNGKKELNFIYFLLVCLLGLVIIGESLMIIKLLSQKSKNITPARVTENKTPVSAVNKSTKGTMTIKMTANNEIVAGEDLKASLVFDSDQTAVAGVDAIISFDPKIVAVKKITQIENFFLTFVVNNQQEKQGRIKITAANPVNQLMGLVELASIDFVLLKSSRAEISMEYKGAGNYTDSNLISAVDKIDLLKSVTPLVIKPKLSQ